MTRIRMLLIATGLCVATLMLLTETQAQGPGGRGNRGGGGGGPGGFGGGGPGGFGGGGPGGRGFGGGGTNFGLLASPQVQVDLKVTDAQVTKLESVRKKADNARQKMLTAMRGNRGGRGGNNNNNALDPTGGAGGGGQATFQNMREAMTEMQQEVEAAYSKILSPAQINRLGQIALQQQGVFSVLRPDLVEKLNMDEDQVVQVREIQNEMRQEQRKARSNQSDVFRQFRTPNGGLDIASLRSKVDSAEFKLQVAANNKAAEEAEKVQDQATAAVGKVLSKKQKESYNRLIGPPFDTTKMTFNRDGSYLSPAGGAATASTAAAGSTKTAAVAPDAADDAPAAKTTAPAATKKKGALRSRRNDD